MLLDQLEDLVWAVLLLVLKALVSNTFVCLALLVLTCVDASPCLTAATAPKSPLSSAYSKFNLPFLLLKELVLPLIGKMVATAVAYCITPDASVGFPAFVFF